MPKLTAMLFDLDGTLLDTAPDLTQAINVVLAQHDRPPTTEAALRPIISSGAKGMLCHVFGLDRQHPALQTLEKTCLAAYTQCLTDKTRLFPGVEALLDELDQRGTPWGVVTNKAYAFSEPLMAHFDLRERSQCLVAGDSLATRKPEPETLLHAAALINTPPAACAYVGDARTDIQAARSAGMLSIAAAYGYLPQHESVENWKADTIVHSPSELKQLAKQLFA